MPTFPTSSSSFSSDLFSNETSSTINITNYRPVKAAQTFHGAPRFGHSADFAALFSNVNEAQQDYIKGVIFVGCLLGVFFLVWLILILFFMAMGRRKVGFLSGRPMIVTPETIHLGWRSRPFRVRMAFFLSYVIVIVFASLLIRRGIGEMEATTNSLEQTNQEIYAIVTGFQNITNNLLAVGRNTSATRSIVNETLGNFCPNNNITLIKNFTNGVDLQAKVIAVSRALFEIGDFITSNLISFQATLRALQTSSQDFTESVNSFNFAALKNAVAIIYVIPSTLLFFGVLLAGFRRTNPCIVRILSWVILPVWIVVVLFAVVGAGAASALVIGNADFCEGSPIQSASNQVMQYLDHTSPDATVSALLSYKGVDATSLQGKAVYFYVTQCRSVDPWLFIRLYRNNLTQTNETVSDLLYNFRQSAISELEAFCGRDFSGLELLLDELRLALSTLSKSVLQGLALLSCRSIVPLYIGITYRTSCAYSVTSLAWTFSGFLILAFFGMIMITLRSAWKDVVMEADTSMQGKDLGDGEDDYYAQETAMREEEIVMHRDVEEPIAVEEEQHVTTTTTTTTTAETAYHEEYAGDVNLHEHEVAKVY